MPVKQNEDGNWKKKENKIMLIILIFLSISFITLVSLLYLQEQHIIPYWSKLDLYLSSSPSLIIALLGTSLFWGIFPIVGLLGTLINRKLENKYGEKWFNGVITGIIIIPLFILMFLIYVHHILWFV